jgi:hypothetical protein
MIDFIDAVESGTKHPKRPPMTALEPSVSQGGIAATLQVTGSWQQGLLALTLRQALLSNRKELGSTFISSEQTLFTIRPYETKDKDDVYSICLKSSLPDVDGPSCLHHHSCMHAYLTAVYSQASGQAGAKRGWRSLDWRLSALASVFCLRPDGTDLLACVHARNAIFSGMIGR